MDKHKVLTEPKKLVALELKNQGFDMDKIKVPQRVYLLADSLYDEMISKNCGIYKYPLGGELFAFAQMKMLGL